MNVIKTMMVLSFVVASAGCALLATDNPIPRGQIANVERLARVKTIALPMAAEPTGYWIGINMSGATAGLLGPLAALASAGPSADSKIGDYSFSESMTRNVSKALQEMNLEVVPLEVSRPAPSSLIRDYGAIPQTSADAVLDIGPIRVGYGPDQSGEYSTKGWGPFLYFVYRVVAMPDREIIAESAVYYSTWDPGEFRVEGIRVVGPEAQLFEDEDAVSQNLDEAARRLDAGTEIVARAVAEQIANTGR